MPKRYSRHCDYCGQHYEGYGERFCSLDCAGADKRGEVETLESLPTDARNEIEDIDHPDGQRTVRVLASDTIRTVDQLLEAASVDLDGWDKAHSRVKKWDVAMKVRVRVGEDEKGNPVMGHEPVAIELFYVEVLLRPSAESIIPAPRRLEIHAPKLPKAGGRGVRHSVHFGDLHIPFHDPAARSIVAQVIERVQPETLVDHGDTMDCTEISRYEKDPHNRVHLNTEITMASLHHGEFHALTPDAEHLWFLGNHEARQKKLIWKLADNRAAGEILTLPNVTDALQWENLTGVGALGWEVVPYPEHRIFRDRLVLIHGNTVRKHSGYSARSEYERFGKSGMSGHTHRRGVYEHRDYNGWHAWWEIGLTGKIRADYTAFPDWQQGFAVVTWSNDYKHFNVEEVRIHDGWACFRGEMIQGDETDTLTDRAKELAAAA